MRFRLKGKNRNERFSFFIFFEEIYVENIEMYTLMVKINLITVSLTDRKITCQF